MNNKIRIRFEYTDECSNNYENESALEVFYEFGDNPIDLIGRQLNTFLKQCGFSRKNDFIFMEDITEDEYDALSAYLDELREDSRKN